MEFEWDESKRQSNIEKHGIDFERAKEIWKGPTLVWRTSRRGEETRITTIGQTGESIVAVVWTEREGVRRIISARPPSREERAYYAAAAG